MIDPGIAKIPGYFVYENGTKEDHWVKLSEENQLKPAVGKVWPGKTVFPDYTNEKTRKWWADLFIDYIANGIDGVWNDMNEIASFQEGGSIPPSSFHQADSHLGGPDTNYRYHNVYGMLMTKATREGIMEGLLFCCSFLFFHSLLTNLSISPKIIYNHLKALPQKRPFVLTRANFTGGQRYSACWTGDNSSSWKHLHFSIPMVLNLTLSGQVCCLLPFILLFSRITCIWVCLAICWG